MTGDGKTYEEFALQTYPDDIESVAPVLKAGLLSGKADVVRSYEVRLSEFFGTSHCVAVSSGSAALHSALVALGVGAGDQVLGSRLITSSRR